MNSNNEVKISQLKDNNENSAEAYKKAFEDVKKYTPPFYVKRKAGFEFI